MAKSFPMAQLKEMLDSHENTIIKILTSRIKISESKIASVLEENKDHANQSTTQLTTRRDSLKRKSKLKIMTDFIKLYDEIPVCVVVTVRDSQVLKLQISDSMSAYITSVVQYLKQVSSDQ